MAMKCKSGFGLLLVLCLGLFAGQGTVRTGEGVEGTARADKRCLRGADRNHATQSFRVDQTSA